MEDTAGGVGNVLMDDLRLRVEGNPGRVAFLVYTVPGRSVPAGASHRLRVWLKTRRDDPSARALDDSYVYQPVRRSAAFKIGARLDFKALGPRIIMGSLAGAPQTVVMEAVGFWFRLVPYHELLGGVGKVKDSAEVDEVDKDADEEVSTENVGRVAGALDDIPDDIIIIPDETSNNPTREGVPAELGEEVAAAARTTRISLHFGRAAKVFKLEEIFNMRRLEEKSPWSGSLMSYALDGKRTLDDLLVEFEEDAPGAPDKDVKHQAQFASSHHCSLFHPTHSPRVKHARALPAGPDPTPSCAAFRLPLPAKVPVGAVYTLPTSSAGAPYFSPRRSRAMTSGELLPTQARSCTPVGFQADRTRHDPPSPTTDSADEKCASVGAYAVRHGIVFRVPHSAAQHMGSPQHTLLSFPPLLSTHSLAPSLPAIPVHPSPLERDAACATPLHTSSTSSFVPSSLGPRALCLPEPPSFPCLPFLPI
ncbi:hypothetical protein B0H14DRAFT_3720435 [Mycena olivaceomarginata]|nr:hypothetical protein B0H14DRAFT_3720435 [Mycena olivaceomarginata]